jgi:hypothetical protein
VRRWVVARPRNRSTRRLCMYVLVTISLSLFYSHTYLEAF